MTHPTRGEGRPRHTGLTRSLCMTSDCGSSGSGSDPGNVILSHRLPLVLLSARCVVAIGCGLGRGCRAGAGIERRPARIPLVRATVADVHAKPVARAKPIARVQSRASPRIHTLLYRRTRFPALTPVNSDICSLAPSELFSAVPL